MSSVQLEVNKVLETIWAFDRWKMLFGKYAIKEINEIFFY